MKNRKLKSNFLVILILFMVIATILIAFEIYKTGTPAVTNLSEQDNGKTVTVAQGEKVKITLNNTYWQFTELTKPEILKQLADPVYNAVSLGVTIPGSGEGTVIVEYQAVSPGVAEVTASRKVCGEALLCTPEQQLFKVTVKVISI